MPAPPTGAFRGRSRRICRRSLVARCSSALVIGGLRRRRQPRRGAAGGEDRRPDRARLSRARHEEHHPRGRRGRGGRRSRDAPRDLSRPDAWPRPRAVTLVDQNDWRGGDRRVCADGAAAARPDPADRRRPTCRRATSTALDTLKPTGAPAAGGAQAIEIGDARARGDLRTRRITGGDPAAAGGRDRRVPHRRRRASRRATS